MLDLRVVLEAVGREVLAVTRLLVAAVRHLADERDVVVGPAGPELKPSEGSSKSSTRRRLTRARAPRRAGAGHWRAGSASAHRDRRASPVPALPLPARAAASVRRASRVGRTRRSPGRSCTGRARSPLESHVVNPLTSPKRLLIPSSPMSGCGAFAKRIQDLEPGVPRPRRRSQAMRGSGSRSRRARTSGAQGHACGRPLP
jgi:hypothetical protein